MKLKDWLGGLDSNQDNQIQNLMYCQLYDLPTGGKEQRSDGGTTSLIAFLCYFTGEWERRQLWRGFALHF